MSDSKHDSETPEGQIEENQDGFEQPSKSAVKREMNRLQGLGTALLDFPSAKIEALPISSALRDALAQARAAKKHGARKRLLQFIGKVMRSEAPEAVQAIEQLLQQRDAASAAATQRLHQLEKLRDDILQPDEAGLQAIDGLLEHYPGADRQWLRQIRRQHLQQLQRGQPPTAARKLFGYLRELGEN